MASSNRFILSIDISLTRKGSLLYSVFFKQRRVFAREYSRQGIYERSNPLAALFLSVLIKLGYKPQPHIRRRLTKNEKNELSMIFPFIEYRGFSSFAEDYEKNKNFPYDLWDEAQRLKKKLLSDRNNADDEWHMQIGDRNTAFLTKCDGKEAVLVTNELVCSNQDLCVLREKEMDNLLPLSESEKNAVVTFSNANTRFSYLQKYVEGGGTNILNACITDKTNSYFELICKAGLGRMADALDQFEGLNPEGKSPTQIFKMPQNLLMKFNNMPAGVSIITTPAEREAMVKAFKLYPELFNSDANALEPIDIMWINYYFMSDPSAEMADFKRSLRYLHKVIDKSKMSQFKAFAYYINYRRYLIGEGTDALEKYPADLNTAIDRIIEELKSSRQTELENRFSKVVSSPSYQKYMHQDQDERFCICEPKSRRDLIEASRSLKNCLGRYSYYDKIISGESVIGLIYEKKQAKVEIIGAIEIKNGCIITQCKTRFNRPLHDNARGYILNYAKEKGLNIDTEDLTGSEVACIPTFHTLRLA